MAISVQVVSHSPIELNYTEPLASDTVLNSINFDVILNVRNDSFSDRVVQISAVTTCDQGEYTNVSETIATDHELMIPLHSRITPWSSKLVTVHFTPTTSGLTCAAYRVLR